MDRGDRERGAAGNGDSANETASATLNGAAGAAQERAAEVLSGVPFRIGRWVVGGLAVAYAATTIIPLQPRPRALDTWVYTGALVLVVLAGLARPALVERDRAGWLLLTVGTVCWAAGDVYWSYAAADADEIPVPSLADAFRLGLYPLALLGLVLLGRSVTRRVPAPAWLDGLVVALAVGAIVSALTLRQIISAAHGPVDELATHLAYPIGDLVLLVIPVATLAMVRWRADPVWWLLGLGFALFAVADTAHLLRVAQHSYLDGSYPDGLWMLGIALVPLAGTLPPARRAPALRGFAALLVPILFSLSALVLLLVAAFVRLHPATVVLAGGCLVAAGVRTALTFEQTSALARSRVEAVTDELTRLGNRRMLDSRLPALTAQAGGRPLTFAIISVRHLAQINDALGYRYGDAMLAALGARLREHLPAQAVSARLGGAEVAMLLPFDGDLPRTERSTRELLAALSAPVHEAGAEVDLELSAGIAVSPIHAQGGDDLIRCANDALRRAKATQSEVEVYDPALDIGRDFGPRLLPDLLAALDTNQLVAHYQPKVDLDTGTAYELEALLQWHHPEHGTVPADALRPLAARAGLTRRLTRVLLTEAVQRCAWWWRSGVRLGVSLDLSTADVLDSRLPYDVARLASESGLPPAAIQLELAEDLLLVDPGRTGRALGQFRSLGVRLALDHYGQSAPSLARLRTMPVQELKLDRSFVASVLDSPPDAAVVQSTVSLAESLGIHTLAEGVDSAELLARLASYGCRSVQGGAVGAPMSPGALIGWLSDADAAPVIRPGWA